MYLEPSVQSVWNHKQQQLLSSCELPLKIGGDERTDSPAKYGSYGVIDLYTNKILHIELVQVYYIRTYINITINHLSNSVTHRTMR